MIKGRLRLDSQFRFWAKVQKTDGCWLWTAARNEKGYGVFGVGKQTDKAHRISFRLTKGPIPKYKFVLHSCDTPSCVRPSHLSLGSNLDNVRDMIAKGRNSAPPLMAGWNRKSISEESMKRLGACSDTELARAECVTKRVIQRLRRERNIPPFPCQTRFKKGGSFARS